MFTPEELLVFADLLQNSFTASALPPERQQELQLRGILSVLEETLLSEEFTPDSSLNNPSPIALLYEAAARHPMQGVRGQAFHSLVRLAQEGRSPAVDTIYRLAVEENLPAARQRILTHGWQPGIPTLRALFDWFTHLNAGTSYPEETIP